MENTGHHEHERTRTKFVTKAWKRVPQNSVPVVVFDIDGVLADMSKFEHLVTAERRQDRKWAQFFFHAVHAAPIPEGLALVHDVSAKMRMAPIYSTTRPKYNAFRTSIWLEEQKLPRGKVLYRENKLDSWHPAIQVKLRHWTQWTLTHGSRNPIAAWIDDDERAVEELRRADCPAFTLKEVLARANEFLANREHPDSNRSQLKAIRHGLALSSARLSGIGDDPRPR